MEKINLNNLEQSNNEKVASLEQSKKVYANFTQTQLIDIFCDSGIFNLKSAKRVVESLHASPSTEDANNITNYLISIVFNDKINDKSVDILKQAKTIFFEVANNTTNNAYKSYIKQAMTIATNRSLSRVSDKSSEFVCVKTMKDAKISSGKFFKTLLLILLTKNGTQNIAYSTITNKFTIEG